ncbi:MAG: PAS domain-containing protein [Polyangiaceae bacterium]|nr:PAS domain-containing protein [Polyangiaceae bacterium]
MKRYVRYLQANPTEIDTVFKELIIGVTSFFRDPEAWLALEPILDEALQAVETGQVFRAWVPACSTGEEAYSLAILLKERMEKLKKQASVQIFATDLDATAIDAARAGEYPLGITTDVSAERINRYFTKDDQVFRIKKEIRELVVFAPQNIIGDPPFTKLDLLCCRNLLIYLDAELQRRLLPIFHYALKAKGYLFLGSSESIGGFGDLFTTASKKWKIFKREDVTVGAYVAEFPMSRMRDNPSSSGSARVLRLGAEANIPQIADRLFLKHLVPPTVLIHQRGDVVHIHGRTGLFLEPAPGPQTAANIFNMVREGLQISLAAAMREAAGTDKEEVHRRVPVRTNGDVHAVDLRVQAIREPEPLRGLFRVTFDDTGLAEESTDEKTHQTVPSRMLELERELQYTKESHQGTIEELETANEELKSTNEEMQSTNEELQSANEELETSKEEMQSLNEELQTVNAELQGKVEELSRANNDMRNLLNGTDIATIFLDNALNIKRFTEQAKRVIRLIPSDVGRSIADLVSTLRYDSLVNDAREVLNTLVFKETEVQGEGEASYLMRILPYRTTENVIEGLVLTFVDITKVRRLQQNQERLLRALESSPTCVFGNDTSLRYRWAYVPVFGRQPHEVDGKTDGELFGTEASKPLTALKRKVLDSGTAARGRIELPVSGKLRTYDLYVEAMRDDKGTITGVSCVATDVS